METKTGTAASLNSLNYLPRFAAFLLHEKLETFVKKQLQYAHDLNLPMLRFFQGMAEEQRLSLSTQISSAFLRYLAANKAAEQIEDAMKHWRNNELPVMDKDSIVADDVLLVNHVRKRAMLDLLPDYTTDALAVIETVKEIDLFVMQSLSAATHQYLGIYKQRLEENAHFIQKVVETVPGAVYVFDTEEYRGIYSNNKLPGVIGYDQEDLNELGENAVARLVHPDDQAVLKEQLEKISASAGDEPVLVKYRIRTKDGAYKWLANYASVFRRTEEGAVSQTIGITLDADKEQKAVAELHRRELERNQLLQKLADTDYRHRQTEALAHIGTYVWNIKNESVEWSEEMYRLYELPAGQQLSHQKVLANVLPDDRPLFQKILRDSVESLKPFDFYYRVVTAGGRVKILHSHGSVTVNEAGEAEKIVGTDQDVTEKQNLIQRLQKSERLYKQVEEIADMGNWNRDVQSDRIEWSDQLYRIYGLAPQAEEITNERFLSFVHPDDRGFVERGVDNLNADGVQDYTFRIITDDGKEKWLRSRAQVLRNEKGEVTGIVGIEQNVTEKEVLINRLKESEQLYKQAQSLAHLGNWTYDFGTGRITWSDELSAIYERPAGAPMSLEEWAAYANAGERSSAWAEVEEAVAQKKHLDSVHHVTLPGGNTKILHRRGEVVYDGAGRPLKLIGTTQDVTQQYQTQSALKVSQNFIQKITDATPAIITSYNVRTGLYSYVSEGLEKLLGYAIPDVIEKGTAFFVHIIHPDDLEPVMEKNRKALTEADASANKKGQVLEFTCRLKHRNGTYRWFHTYSTVFDTDETGNVRHVLNITLDVTEQKEAVETIREQEYFIQQIAEASPTILYLFDVATQSMAYINREAFFVLGYLPEEMVEEGSGLTERLYHPDDLHLLPARRQSGKSFQQVDSMIQYECRMKHKDGEYRWLLVREIVFKTDEQGGIRQIIGAALDITRRKDMERTILQNTHQLEQSNASLEEFAYVASHDLKEPLRKISTFGDRLVASQMDKLSGEGKIYLTKIVDASQRMQAMISDLLSISMISGNKGFERVSLQKILEETLQTLEYKIEQQKAVIRYERLPDASVVPSQFRQLFQNLISNSLKFVREGVRPVVTVDCKTTGAEEAARYGLRKAAAYLELTFSDNGIGFENEYAQKIFAIFHRLHGRSEYEGSGIGLAICKKIAEHHGGVIFASGMPGAGARFTLLIPA